MIRRFVAVLVVFAVTAAGCIGFVPTADPIEGTRLTTSCGVSRVAGPEDGSEASKRADRALYRAKADGRNRMVTFTEIAEA